MVLVVEKKFLEEDWWRYALASFLLQLLFWVLLGYKINPSFTIKDALLRGYWLIGIFLVAAFLPFIAGRLQMKRLFWFGFIGFLLGLASYYSFSILGFGKRFSLLPSISFIQVYTTCFGLGIVFEFGRYVFRKLSE